MPERAWFETDYYKALGVADTATDKEITRAYRKLAKTHHPDANPGSEERFKEISAAYDVLGDPAKRKEYDEVRRLGPMAGGFSPPGGFRTTGGTTFNLGDLGGIGDLFGGLFGSRGRGPRRGADVEAALHLSFEDAVRGVTTSVHLPTDAKCKTCQGSGAAPGTGRETCPQCKGSGRVREVSSLGGFGQFIRTSTCNVCRGSGSIVKQPCETCRGTGRQRAVRTVKIDIPAGIADGQRLRLSGEGGAGSQGGRAGDLYVLVRVAPDERFMRDGDDLIYRLDITMIEAALGTTVGIPALDGDIELTLPAGTQPGEVKTYRNRGVPVLQGYGRGDLRVVVNVTVPRHLTAEQRELLERFEEMTTAKNYEADESFFDKVKAVFRQ
jgi:molecular chaperone DnaJ